MTEAERRRTVTVFDTTLRDGEQAPGASLGQAAKVRAAHAIADLGVDVLEAGFPAASAGEAEAVARIAREVRGPTIAALARAGQADVETAARSIGGAGRSRIHVFIATSDIHLEKKLHMTRSECLARTASAVERATAMADEIEFSAEDATRSDVAFLVSVYQAAVASGATTVNIPDTVGYAQPQEFAALVHAIRAALPDTRVKISVHCHNDLGLAVALSPGGRSGSARHRTTKRGRWRRATYLAEAGSKAASNALRSRTPSPRSARARIRSTSPSTASGSAAGTHRSKRPSWRCAAVRIGIALT